MSQEKGFISYIAAGFLFIFIIIITGFVTYAVHSRRIAYGAMDATTARYVAEAGLEKSIWALNSSSAYSGESHTNFGGGQFTSVVTSGGTNLKKIQVTAWVPNATKPKATRTVKATIGIDNTIVSFTYAVQSGNGGFYMNNNSRINGGVFSNGTIVGTSGTVITGDAFSAGPGGFIQNMVIGGNAHAHALSGCTIGKDAYYVSLSSCTVAGVKHPNYADPTPMPFPISDDDVANWSNQANYGSTYNGNLSITGNRDLGPIVINGNVSIAGGVSVNIKGTVWINGALTFGNGTIMKLDPSYGANSEVVYVRDRIILGNNDTFSRTDPNSYIMLFSDSTSLNSSAPAINLMNNVTGVIFYARNGLIHINNNVSLEAVTAYKIMLDNNVILTYNIGFGSKSFQGGPGGSWAYTKNSYISE